MPRSKNSCYHIALGMKLPIWYPNKYRLIPGTFLNNLNYNKCYGWSQCTPVDPAVYVNRPAIVRLCMFLESQYQSHSRKAHESSVQFLFVHYFKLFLIRRYHFSVATIQSDMHKGMRLILEMPFWKTKKNSCIFPFVAAAVSGVLSLAHNITDQIFWKYILKKLNE